MLASNSHERPDLAENRQVITADDLCNRMKAYEATGGKLDPHLSNYAGIDSRAFSTFTRDMTRPFDVQRGGCLRMTLCVIARRSAMFAAPQIITQRHTGKARHMNDRYRPRLSVVGVLTSPSMSLP